MLNADIILSQKTRVGSISLIKDHEASTTISRGVVCINLFPKEQYIAQQARGAYLAYICQPKASFNLFYAAQSTKFSSDNIITLNKQL